MTFRIAHTNFNVANVDAAVTFYKKALGLKEMRRSVASDGRFTIVFMGDEKSEYLLELTQLTDHPQKYDLGENELHVAFVVDDFNAAHKLHKEMGCICYENEGTGIYFIEDPDGYWLEIVPQR
ncbi:MAG: VOC family protein [Oscillospiraceae bacterium]|jgi:lactoylglutathione lyase|nr:VOC family protein [Oscillospiraceae bacterium]